MHVFLGQLLHNHYKVYNNNLTSINPRLIKVDKSNL